MAIRFSGRTFLFTGRLENYTRQQAYDLVLERGGMVTNAFSNSVDYLIVGDKPGGKLRKANASRICEVYNELEFTSAVLKHTPGFVPRKSIVIPTIPSAEIITADSRVFSFDE